MAQTLEGIRLNITENEYRFLDSVFTHLRLDVKSNLDSALFDKSILFGAVHMLHLDGKITYEEEDAIMDIARKIIENR